MYIQVKDGEKQSLNARRYASEDWEILPAPAAGYHWEALDNS